MREFCYRLQREPDSIPEHHRSPIGGPLEKLTDHPIVLGFMNEFVATDNSGADCYGFRMEGTFLTIREHGQGLLQTARRAGHVEFPGKLAHLSYAPRQGTQRVDASRMGTESSQETQRRYAIFNGKPQSRLSAANIDAESGLSVVGGLFLSGGIGAILY